MMAHLRIAAVMCACLFGLATVSQAAIEDALISYWALEGNANDTGGVNANHGAFFDVGDNGDGAAIASGYTAGKFGQALDLIGDDVVSVPDHPSLNLTGSSLSISMWVKADSFTKNWQAAIAKGEGSNYRIARRGGDDPQVMAYAGGTGDIPGSAIGPDIDDNLWHHVVAITEHGVSTRLWVDGGLVATSGGAPSIGDNDAIPLYIGGNPDVGDADRRSWDNMIDDVAMWNRVLTTQEIADIWNGGTGASIESLITPIPEPSSIVLAVLGVMGAGYIGWRRRRHKA